MKNTKPEPTTIIQAVHKARSVICKEMSKKELSLLADFTGQAAVRTFGGSPPSTAKSQKLFANIFDVRNFATLEYLASDRYQRTNSERFMLSLKNAQRFRNLSLVSKRGEKLTFSYRIGRIDLKCNDLYIPLGVTLLLSISPKNATVEYIVHSARCDNSEGDRYSKNGMITDFTNRISNEFIRQSLLAFNSGVQQWKADYLDSVLSEVFISTLASIERKIKSCNKRLGSSLLSDRQKEELRLEIQNLESTLKPLFVDLRSSGLKIEYEKIEVNSEYKNCAYGEQGKYLFEPVRCLEELLKAGIHLTNELIGFAHSKHHYKKLEPVNLDGVQRDLPKWRKNPRNDEQFVRLCTRKYAQLLNIVS